MTRISKVIVVLAILMTLGIATPATAEEPIPQLEDVCVKFSTDPPGASVDPWCKIGDIWPPI